MHLFIERNITCFDPDTAIGERNLKAYRCAKVEPKESWHYIWITPEELSSWRLYRDYYYSPTQSDNPEILAVFNYDKCRKVKDITNSIAEAREKNVLL